MSPSEPPPGGISVIADSPVFRLFSGIASLTLPAAGIIIGFLWQVGVVDPISAMKLDHVQISKLQVTQAQEIAVIRADLGNHDRTEERALAETRKAFDEIRSTIRALTEENIKLSITVSRMAATQEAMQQRLLILDRQNVK